MAYDDETVVVKRGQPAPKGVSRRFIGGAAAAGLCACCLGAAGYFALRPRRPTVAPIGIRTADEPTILANRVTGIDVFRFSLNPQILVIDFASLAQQGSMLNRIAAMSEKSGEPHDRALDNQALDQAIRADGDVPETYYYGHDYGTAELSAFFNATDREKLQLTADELWLRRLLQQEGAEQPGKRLGLISVPAESRARQVDHNFRATILHHELSHGEFFTNPQYADWVRAFWHDEMKPYERKMFSAFLGSQHYDQALDDLMANETQAYLMFTPDRRFFRPDLVGMDATDIQGLRGRFRDGMPPGWLRDQAQASAAL